MINRTTTEITEALTDLCKRYTTKEDDRDVKRITALIDRIQNEGPAQAILQAYNFYLTIPYQNELLKEKFAYTLFALLDVPEPGDRNACCINFFGGPKKTSIRPSLKKLEARIEKIREAQDKKSTAGLKS